MDLITDLRWRLELEPDVRPKQIDRILVSLMIFFPNCASIDLDELKKMAEWFEEENFIEAKSYINYLDRIYMRLQKLEMRFPTTDAELFINQGQQLLSQNTIVSDGAIRSASLSPAMPSTTSLTKTSVPNVAAGLKMQSGIAKKEFSSQKQQLMKHNQGQQLLSQNTIVSDRAKRSASLSPAPPSMASLTKTSVPNAVAGLKMQSGIAKKEFSSQKQQLMKHNQGQQLLSQNTIVSDRAKRSASLSPAPPSMTSLTKTSVPKVVAGLKMQSGIAKKQFSSQKQQVMKHNQGQQLLSQNTIVSDRAKRSASLSPAPPSMTSLTKTSVPNVVAGLKMQSGIAKKQFSSQKQQLMKHNQGQQLLSQNTIVSDRAKRSASLSPALPSMTSTLTQTSVPNVAGLKMQPGIAKNMLQQFSSQEQHHRLMKQNLLQPTQMSNDVGRSSTNTQSETAHAQDLFQKQQEQQLMKQNLLQPTQRSKVVGRSTNTQSEIAHAQDLFQQKQQHQLMNPQLFSSSMNSNAQTGQNADDWKEEVYQEMQVIKQRYLPYLKDIYQKTFKECQHLKRNDSVSNVPQCERQKLDLLESLEAHLRILNVSKDRVISSMKGNLSKYEKTIIHMIESNWPLEPVSAQQQIQQPGGHPLSTQPQPQPQPQQQQEEIDNQPDATKEIIDLITDSE